MTKDLGVCSVLRDDKRIICGIINYNSDFDTCNYIIDSRANCIMARSKKKRAGQSVTIQSIGGPSDFIPNEVSTLCDCLRKIQSIRPTLPNPSKPLSDVGIVVYARLLLD